MIKTETGGKSESGRNNTCIQLNTLVLFLICAKVKLTCCSTHGHDSSMSKMMNYFTVIEIMMSLWSYCSLLTWDLVSLWRILLTKWQKNETARSENQYKLFTSLLISAGCWQEMIEKELRVRKETNIQALHSSGCLKGKARPLSMAAILMQESGQFSGHSGSCRKERGRRRRRRSEDTSPLNDKCPITKYWSWCKGPINWTDRWQPLPHISAWHLMTGDSSQKALWLLSTARSVRCWLVPGLQYSAFCLLMNGPCVCVCVWAWNRV